MSKAAVASLLAAALLGGQPAFAAGEGQTGVIVIVAKATNACFSDRVRVSGFLVPQSVAIANVDSEGFKVTEVLVGEGDMVTSGQTLARLSRPAMGGAPAANAIVKAPAAGLIIGKAPMVGTLASMQAEPLFRIVVDGKIDLDVEVPSLHVPKLKPGATARVAVDGGPERQQLIEGHTERVDVGAAVNDDTLSQRLLGAHVAERAEEVAGHRHARFTRDPREAEVRDEELGAGGWGLEARRF